MTLRYTTTTIPLLFFLNMVLGPAETKAQTADYQTVQINPDETHQTIAGFGASLAYYENWLTAHPNRAEIYNVIFSELSLDILRVRNAHGYDASMIDRVKQFALAAQSSLGHPIDIMVTSWGPPAYLKSNNDRNNGGTLKYTVDNGIVNFDYAGFAKWWDQSLNAYKAKGIYPKYISIQNEPDWKASYESCLLKPAQYVNSTDTIAGYNKALEAVYDTVMKRTNPPLFLGPECIGIGYNAVENYVNALDITKLHGIGHHLYHGAESGTVENDPFTSSNYEKVGNFHPEVPHFQTEYSRAGWFTLAGMMFQSLAVENVTAFLYWDLIWSEGGLVSLDFPWDRSRWTNTKGYTRTKDYYVFKHYSKFIHPGWKRIGTSLNSSAFKAAAFISSSGDSASFIAINRSAADSFNIRLDIPGFRINQATAYATTENLNFEESDYMIDTIVNVPPKSVITVDLHLSKINTSLAVKAQGVDQRMIKVSSFPNPFSSSIHICFVTEEASDFSFEVFDIAGNRIRSQKIGYFPAGENDFIFQRDGLPPGVYLFVVRDSSGKSGIEQIVVSD